VLFFSNAPLPKALWIGYRNLRSAKELVHLEEHGSVFTRSPSLRNPYTIQFSRCSPIYNEAYSNL
jgi:hypothetical protein